MTFHHRLAVIMTFCVLQPFILHALNMSPLFKLDFSKAEEWKPSETVFLLVSDDADRVLPTIQSRSMRINFRPLPELTRLTALHFRLLMRRMFGAGKA